MAIDGCVSTPVTQLYHAIRAMLGKTEALISSAT